ncbi:MAG: adenylate/guanylate cyclase domain-containing protein, partial [Spirochaetia bacterium]|nr:adenylate/guanylate cyclase domain-containing protein [Spirochaetia bacterium]
MRGLLATIAILLSACSQGSQTPPPTAVAGQIDLRTASFAENDIQLSGEWAFYPGIFLSTEFPAPTAFLKVPAVWNGQKLAERELPGFGAGTYRLQVLLPSS